MAKRKTIRVNPLDTLVPGPRTSQTSESGAPAKARSAGPASIIPRKTTQQNQPSVEENKTPTPATQAAQPPSSVDLLNRVQSLEQQNEYLKWVVGGAILLAIFL